MKQIRGFPVVRVPVLSNRANCTSAADSRISPPLAISPNDDAEVRATACGTGEASRSEHGQDTTHSKRVVRMASSIDPG